MSTYVLIHGACHGSWCWYKLTPLLEQQGHRVIAPDLPGRGDNMMPYSQISLRTYADSVCELLDAEPEPVILVGHSLAGIFISQAAEYRPDKIRILVYIAAPLLQNGQSVARKDSSSSPLVANLLVSDDYSHVSMRMDTVGDFLYADCSAEDVELAKTHLCPEATSPFLTPLKVSEHNFGRIPRVYVECLQDRAIALAVQRNMSSMLKCQKIFTMNTSHSPFLSAPEELARYLLSL